MEVMDYGKNLTSNRNLILPSSMCPLSVNKSELCNAALSSSMINESLCLNDTHYRCAIFAIKSLRNKDGAGADVPETVEQKKIAGRG
jgi:hypothetical protein